MLLDWGNKNFMRLYKECCLKKMFKVNVVMSIQYQTMDQFRSRLLHKNRQFSYLNGQKETY